MQKRILLSVILSIIIILVSLGIISYHYVNDSIESSLQGRLALAKIISRYFDDIIESNLKRLYDISISGKIDFSDGDWNPEKRALMTAYEYSIFTDRIFLLDMFGNVVLTYPHLDSGAVNMLNIPYIGTILSERREIISDVYNSEPFNRKVIYTLVPLRDKNGNFIGVAGGEINPTNYIFSQKINSIPVRPETKIELIDGQGTIIASNDPTRILTSSDHNEFLSNLIKKRQNTVSTCHRCHVKESAEMSRTQDMLAFAPLTVPAWGISVREPQELVFLPATNLKYGFLVLGLIAIVSALVLTLGISRSIVRPVQGLINAARRIGGGDLSSPILISSKDEIGTLAKSFDTMRQRLLESLNSIKDHNIKLEQRVAERTAELQQNRRRLQMLFNELIKAQEDERKRIARELHDETSQSLAALGMSIDIAEMALNENSLAPDGIKELKTKLDHVLDGINILIRDLRPPVLDDLGFESGVQWLLERHLGKKGIAYSFFISEGFHRTMSAGKGHISNKTELMLFRVVQEVIINIAKHAQAKNVALFLCSDDKYINIGIEDNGIGFDVKEVLRDMDRGENGGFGVIGMKERIALLEGSLDICSKPNEGTFISIEVPIRTTLEFVENV